MLKNLQIIHQVGSLKGCQIHVRCVNNIPQFSESVTVIPPVCLLGWLVVF